MKTNPAAIEYLPESQYTKELLYKSLELGTTAIQVAPKQLKDFDLYLHAIRCNPHMLEHDIVHGKPYWRAVFLRAIKDDPSFMQIAREKQSWGLVTNPDLALVAVKLRYEALQYFAVGIRQKYYIVMAAI
jgi:hypothetical protein